MYNNAPALVDNESALPNKVDFLQCMLEGSSRYTELLESKKLAGQRLRRKNGVPCVYDCLMIAIEDKRYPAEHAGNFFCFNTVVTAGVITLGALFLCSNDIVFAVILFSIASFGALYVLTFVLEACVVARDFPTHNAVIIDSIHQEISQSNQEISLLAEYLCEVISSHIDDDVFSISVSAA
jgi:hypothetical protein